MIISCLLVIATTYAQTGADAPASLWSTNTTVPQSRLEILDSKADEYLLPTANCFCVISSQDLIGVAHSSSNDICLDLTADLNVHYTEVFPQKDANRQDCANKCGDYILHNVQNNPTKMQQLANCFCAKGVGNGTEIRGYGGVGTKEYRQAQTLGHLTNTPAVNTTTCTCPASWLSNSSNQNGGVTTDGKCKRKVCGPIATTSLPPNGTAISTWGFTWGNEIWEYGSVANGGKPNCITVTTSPKVCKIQ